MAMDVHGLRLVLLAACLIGPTGGLPWTTARTLLGPVLDVHKKEMTTDLGSDLVLTCTGKSNLTWQFPDVETVIPSTRTRLTIESNLTVSGDFVSVLRVQAVQYSDTGYYTCMYSTKEDLGPVDMAASVYVYVPDMDHMYAPPFEDKPPEHPILGVMYGGTPYVLPCRPTHPRAEVTLRKALTGARVEVGGDITYDRKEGFKILYPNVFFNGMFECVFSFNKTVTTLSAIITYKAGTAVPQPEMETTHENVLIGETMRFKCFVLVKSGTIVHMEWSYPSNEHSDRIRITPPVKESKVANGVHYNEVESTLTIKTVAKIDAGVYRCTVTNHDRKTNYVERTAYVREETFVNLTPMKRTVEAKKGTVSLYLSMSVYAYPTPVIAWYKGDTPIDLTDRHYEVKGRSDRTKLKIFNIGMEDAGDYVVRAYTRDMNTSETITLTVTEPPKVTLVTLNGTDYHLVDTRYIMACRYTGTPLPAVRWQWQPCAARSCSLLPSGWTEVIHSANTPQVKSAERSTHLLVVARESGFYRCVATNKEGEDSQVLPFYVSDVNANSGFAQEASSLNPVEGDTLTLTCRAHALVFSTPRMYHVERSNQHILLTNRTGLSITQTRTNHSQLQTLTLSNIQLSDSGMYYCQTEDKYGGQHKSRTPITVRPMQGPVFIKHLHGTFYMEPTSKYVLECDAVGLPLPHIDWFKDDEPLDTADSNLLLNGNQTRLTFKQMNPVHSGVYMCEASNRAGSVSSNVTLNVKAIGTITAKATQPALSNVHIGMIVGVFSCIIILIIVVTIITRRHCQPRYYSDEYLLASKTGFNPDMPIDEQTDTIPYNIKWEFPRERLNFGMLLGQGAFGKVVRAEAVGICGTDGTTIVAVKMPKDFSDADQMKALLSELKVLIHVGQHLNIVNLLGACTRDMRKGLLYVIVEYCRYGNLLNYLLRKRPEFQDTMEDIRRKSPSSTADGSAAARNELLSPREYVNTSLNSSSNEQLEPPDLGPLRTKDLVCFAFQIARGMDYLSSRKYIHRDLAARNVLLADDGVVKIADFGLAKDCYKYDAYQKKTNGPVPVKWLALESLTHKIYTSKSDVWSYGVLLWELFTVGGNPYPTVTIDETFVERLKNGYRMERPPYASEQIYNIMLHCWSPDPEDRPEFSALSERFGNLLQASVKQHYIDLETQQCLLVADRGTTGYLRMAGSTLASYIPMSSVASEDSASRLSASASASGGDITLGDNSITENDDSGYDFSLNGHAPLVLSTSGSGLNGVYKIPRVETVNECDEDDEAADSGGSHTPDDLSVSSDKEVTVETQAMVHTSGPPSEEEAGERPVDGGDAGSDSSPFLNRTDSDKSDNSGPRRGRNYKGDSVSSDASSGFHSCYFPDDVTPTEGYSPGPFPHSIPPKEVMV